MKRLSDDLAALVGIGPRLAGSNAEAQAVNVLVERLGATGAVVEREGFPVREHVVTRQQLELRIGGQWRRYPAQLFSSTPGTGGRTVEAPLVVLDPVAEAARPDWSHVTGKAVLHLGCHIESRQAYRRLIEANPAFLLLVDVRYPGDTPLADGMFPSYVSDIGARPTLNVAFQDAWHGLADGADAARICIEGGPRPAFSANVVASLPGRDSREILYVGAHHDTQADSPGADDNAVGTVMLLELARLLAPLPRRRTLRFISFGAEEQLSVGSASYVRAHRAEIMSAGGFMFNFDACGSLLGWNNLVCNGPAAMGPWLASFFRGADLWPRVNADITPYSDHFPFVAAGIPAAFL